MSSHLGVSIRFLAAAFHGRRDGGVPEWPPSPLRLFQALVATAAARERSGSLAPEARSALRWLEQQGAPTLVAASGVAATGYRLSVPNNAMDIVAKAWSRGGGSSSGDSNPATHRTMKPVRPTLLIGGDAAHYLWALPDRLAEEARSHLQVLQNLARSLVAVGWGLDLVVGHGTIVSDAEADGLPGERWLPGAMAADEGLRVPVPGTLDDLIERHRRFLVRLGPGGVLTPPPPLSAYATVEYRQAADSPLRPAASFSLLKLDGSGFRGFDTARRALTVAGMMRHTVSVAAKQAGWSEPRINAFVLGHGETRDDAGHVAVGPRRFAYMPLPSIESRGRGKARAVGLVRRVALCSFAEGCEAEIAWARQALSGQELIQLIGSDKHEPVALLSAISSADSVVHHYTGQSAAWATVTPVVLPGYDDPGHYRRRLKRETSGDEQKKLLNGLAERIDGLLRKAINQSGFSTALADHADLDWRKAGFWAGAEHADRYGVPNHLKRFPRYHVRVAWRDANNEPVAVTGPVCLGAGRFYGLGLFATLES